MYVQQYNRSKHSVCTTSVCTYCQDVQQTEPFKVYAFVMTKCCTGVQGLDKITTVQLYEGAKQSVRTCDNKK